jgi:hypothetical protein
LQKHANKRNESTYYIQSGSEYESESEWSMDKSRRRSSYSPRNTIQESKKGKDSYKRKEEESQDRQNRNKKKFKQESRDIEHTNTLSALEGALQEIAERLSKLEEKGKKSRIAYRS